MRSPPSPLLFPSYPVSAGISLMAVAVTAMTRLGKWNVERFTVTPAAFHSEPWRLLISALPHIGVFHLLFNVYWLWIFGTLLEEVLGHVRLLGLIALFAAGSMAADYALSHGGVGLSGVGYGLFAMLWVLAPRDRRFAEGVDKNTSQTFVFWFFFCIATTWFGIMPVANVAHGVGALLGALVGMTMAPRAAGAPENARATLRRVLAGVGILAVLAASYAGATVLRSRVNLAHDDHGSFQLGFQALEAKRYDEAIRHYRDAVAINPKDMGAWNNLGIAYARSGRDAEALTAWRRAYEVEHDGTRRALFIAQSHRVAAQAQASGDHQRAVDVLRGILEIDPDDGEAWTELSFSHEKLGQKAEAEVARQKAATASPRRRAP